MTILTPAQCRAARGILRWNQEKLAEAAQVGVATIRLFENEQTEPRRATLSAIRQALENANIEFTSEEGALPGVRPKKM